MKKVIFLIVFSIIIVATAVSASNLVVIVSPDMAKESVKEFMNNSKIDLILGDELSFPTGEFYVMGTNSDEFWVNKNSGIVERATFYSEMFKTSNDLISKEKALEIASSYAKKHYKNFETVNMRLDYQEFHDTGIDTEYTFIWHEYQQDIETVSFVLVTVNANSGGIIEYAGISRDIDVSLKPIVTEKKAVEIASNYFDIPASDVKSIQLKVINLNLMDQRLIWEVIMEGKPVNYTLQGGSVQIDANDGNILRVFNLL
jgi:uncharacterized membrane protein YkoI